MKILVANWQDLGNPHAGGAEIHLHQIFGRLAGRGHEVVLLCSGYEGAPARAEVDGMEVHRVGSRYTFSLHAARYYAEHLAGRGFDVLVEDLNKVPLFSPRWSRSPVVLLVHHLFGLTAFREASFPLAAATWLLERPIPWIYRGCPTQAVSQSTADDLAARGLRRQDIEVIHNGVDLGFFTPAPGLPRFDAPTFLYLGRLQRYKRVDLILQAVAHLARRGTPVRLLVGGKGQYQPELQRLAQRLGIAQNVEFLGFVSEEEKRDLFRRAWANLYTSPKEGWGITNLEAAGCGTPTIASDAPGLRESVVHGETGLLVPHGDVAALAEAIARLAAEPARVARLGRGALAFAQRFSWDASAEATEAHLLTAAGHRLSAAPTSSRS